MELPPNQTNDWLCSTRLLTHTPEQELYNLAFQPDFVPAVLTARKGSAFPHLNGVLHLMFELVQLTYPEAEEESHSIVDTATSEMNITVQGTFCLDIRPLNDPRLPGLPSNVINLNDYRKWNFRK